LKEIDELEYLNKFEEIFNKKLSSLEKLTSLEKKKKFFLTYSIEDGKAV